MTDNNIDNSMNPTLTCSQPQHDPHQDDAALVLSGPALKRYKKSAMLAWLALERVDHAAYAEMQRAESAAWEQYRREGSTEIDELHEALDATICKYERKRGAAESRYQQRLLAAWNRATRT